MKAMKIITQQIAGLLAVKAHEQIVNHFNKKSKTDIDKLRKSQDYTSLRKLFNQQQKAISAFVKLSGKLEKKYGLDINSSFRSLNIKERRRSIPSGSMLKNQLIVANQIDGVDPKKVVEHVVRKYIS